MVGLRPHRPPQVLIRQSEAFSFLFVFLRSFCDGEVKVYSCSEEKLVLTCAELNDFINRRQISAALESFGKLFSIIVPLQQFQKVFCV